MASWTEGVQAGAGLLGGVSSLIGTINAQKNFRRELEQRQQFFNQNMQNTWDMWNATNQYNSPANQAALMKQAGLNPDLQDMNFQGASPSEMPDAQQNFVERPNFFQNLANAIPSILDGVERFQRVQMNNELLDQERIKTAMATDPIVENYIFSTENYDSIRRRYDEFINSGVKPEEAAEKLSELLVSERFGNIPYLSRRSQKYYESRFKQLIMDKRFLGQTMALHDDVTKHAENIQKRNANPMFSRSVDYADPSAQASMLMNLYFDTYMEQLRAQGKRASYDNSFYTGANAGLASSAFNNQNKYNAGYYGTLNPRERAGYENWQYEASNLNNKFMQTFIRKAHSWIETLPTKLQLGAFYLLSRLVNPTITPTSIGQDIQAGVDRAVDMFSFKGSF